MEKEEALKSINNTIRMVFDRIGYLVPAKIPSLRIFQDEQELSNFNLDNGVISINSEFIYINLIDRYETLDNMNKIKILFVVRLVISMIHESYLNTVFKYKQIEYYEEIEYFQYNITDLISYVTLRNIYQDLPIECTPEMIDTEFKSIPIKSYDDIELSMADIYKDREYILKHQKDAFRYTLNYLDYHGELINNVYFVTLIFQFISEFADTGQDKIRYDMITRFIGELSILRSYSDKTPDRDSWGCSEYPSKSYPINIYINNQLLEKIEMNLEVNTMEIFQFFTSVLPRVRNSYFDKMGLSKRSTGLQLSLYFSKPE